MKQIDIHVLLALERILHCLCMHWLHQNYDFNIEFNQGTFIWKVIDNVFIKEFNFKMFVSLVFFRVDLCEVLLEINDLLRKWGSLYTTIPLVWQKKNKKKKTKKFKSCDNYKRLVKDYLNNWQVQPFIFVFCLKCSLLDRRLRYFPLVL